MFLCIILSLWPASSVLGSSCERGSCSVSCGGGHFSLNKEYPSYSWFYGVFPCNQFKCSEYIYPTLEADDRELVYFPISSTWEDAYRNCSTHADGELAVIDEELLPVLSDWLHSADALLQFKSHDVTPGILTGGLVPAVIPLQIQLILLNRETPLVNCTIEASPLVLTEINYLTTPDKFGGFLCEASTLEESLSDKCVIHPSYRGDCGYPGISRDACLSRGCCYLTTDRYPCFYDIRKGEKTVLERPVTECHMECGKDKTAWKSCQPLATHHSMEDTCSIVMMQCLVENCTEMEHDQGYVTLESGDKSNSTRHVTWGHIYNNKSTSPLWLHYIKHLVLISVQYYMTSLVTNTKVGFYYISQQREKYTISPLVHINCPRYIQYSMPCAVILHKSHGGSGGSFSCKWAISVDISLSIQLDFHEFTLKYASNDCVEEYLALKFGSNILKFCGHRDPWSELIDSWHLEIHLKLLSKVYSMILMKYTVIEKIYVLPKVILNEDNHGSLSLWLNEHTIGISYKLDTCVSIMWRIRAAMIDAISVDLKNKNWIPNISAYDGPDSSDKFKLRSFNETAYKSSGFVMLISCTVCDMELRINISLTYVCFPNIGDGMVCNNNILTKGVIHLSRSSMKYDSDILYCLLVIERSPFVNMTILEVQTSGPDADMCIHMGFFFYIFPTLKYEGDGIVGPYCDADILKRISTAPYNQVISHNERLLLGFYMYGVWEFTFKAEVSQSTCQGIFQPCGAYGDLQYPLPVFHHGYVVSRSTRHSYEKVFMIANVQTCVVIQQFPQMRDLGVYWCEVSTDVETENRNQMNGQLVDMYVSMPEEKCSSCEEEVVLVEGISGSLRTEKTLTRYRETLPGPIHLEYWTPRWNTRLLTMFRMQITQSDDMTIPYSGDGLTPTKYYGQQTQLLLPISNSTFKLVFIDINYESEMTHVCVTLERSRECFLPCIEDTIEFYHKSYGGDDQIFTKNLWVWKSVHTRLWEWYLRATEVYDKEVYIKIGRLMRCTVPSDCATSVTYSQNHDYLTPRIVQNRRRIKNVSKNHCKYVHEFCTAFEDCFTMYSECGTISWETANQLCLSSGGQLLIISDSEKQRNVRKAWLAATSMVQLKQRGYTVIFIGLIHNSSRNFWVNGEPLVYSSWHNPLKNWRNPSGFIPDWKHAYDMSHGYPNDEIFHLTSSMQPFYNETNNCTFLMFASVHMDFSWVKIPCDLRIESQKVLCEHQKVSSKVRKRKPITITVIAMCPIGWLWIDNICLQIQHYHSPDSDGDVLCLTGNTSTISQRQLTEYFNVIKFKPTYGAVCIQGTLSDGCTFYTSKYLAPHDDYPLGLKESPPGSENRYVICQREMTVVPAKCSPYMFRCPDDSCILQSFVCDGVKDCSQGEDENNCKELCYLGQKRHRLQQTFVVNPEDILDVRFDPEHKCSSCKASVGCYCGRNYFQCQSGGCILLDMVCDFIVHCTDQSDESFCVHPTCSPEEYSCLTGQCIPKSKHCDMVKHCTDGSDEVSCLDHGEHSFLCLDGKKLYLPQVNDLIPDCSGGEDEADIITQMEAFFFNQTTSINLDTFCKIGEIPCLEGTSSCFPMHKACIYEKTESGDLAHCRNGAHVGNCSHMQCPGYFKCHLSYCIPPHSVCDGQIDCPLGSDEIDCPNLECPYLLRCKATRLCISPIYMCDGVAQCLHFQDDERFCDFPSCPPGCKCNAGRIHCTDVLHQKLTLISLTIYSIIVQNNKETLDLEVNTHYTYFINLAQNGLTSLKTIHLKNMHNLLYLSLSHNKLISFKLGFFKEMSNLLELVLTGNHVHTLFTDTFLGLSSMRFLNLSRLSLYSLQTGSLQMHGLKLLDISHNSLTQLQSGLILNDLLYIQYFYCDSNPISHFDVTSLSSLNSLSLFKGDDHFFCCFVHSSATCHPGENILKPCQYLFYTPGLRISVCTMASLALVGNTLALMWFSARSPWHSRLLALVALSDLTMAIYLSVLILADARHRHDPLYIQRRWTSSMFCRVAAFCNTYATVSSLVNMVIALAVKILVFAYPFTFRSHIKVINQVAIYISVLVAVLSFLLVTAWALPLGLPFSLCHLLTVVGSANLVSKGYTYFYGLFAFLVLSVTTVTNCVVVAVFKTSRDHLSRKMSDVEKQFSSRVLLGTLVNVLTWCPQIILIFSHIIGKQMPAKLWIWITVTVLPLNAALDPMVYVFCSHHFISFVRAKLVK